MTTNYQFETIVIDGVSYVSAPPDAKRTANAMSKLSYNFEKAIADLVDNSIAAGATKIEIEIEQKPATGKVYVHVMDNGEGMSKEQLPNAIRYGADDHGDPSRLNVFGYGLKTACQSFTTKFSVISRTQSDPTVNVIDFDLKIIEKYNQFLYKMDVASKKYSDLLNDFSSHSSGTIILIEDANAFFTSDKGHEDERKARKFVESRVEATKDHLRKVFQRFLDEDDPRVAHSAITVNGDSLLPWDPFCLAEPKVDLVVEKKFEGLRTKSGKVGNVIFRGYILPDRVEFSDSNLASDAQIGPQTHGVYVYRQNRLIEMATYFDPPLFKRETHMKSLRMEFSYDGTLDDLFDTGLQKASMRLGDLEDAIREEMRPLVREADLRSRGKKRTRDSSGSHDLSNKTIKDAESRIEQAKIEPIDENSARVETTYGPVVLPIKSKNDGNPVDFIIPVEQIDDGLLWQLRYQNGKQVVELNKGHEFYDKVYHPLRENSIAVRGLDFLLWALAIEEARCTIPDFKRQLVKFRFQVSMNLRELVESMPENRDVDE
jgi:hypothetical protein